MAPPPRSSSPSAPTTTGRGLLRALPPGAAAGLGEPRGFGASFYGTVLPGPDLGRRGGDVMRSARDAGHETGLLAWNGVRWRRLAAHAEAAWTEAAMQQGVDAYSGVFGEPPQCTPPPDGRPTCTPCG